MTCKDAINSDASSEDKKLYFLSESTKYNKIFESELEGTTDHNFIDELIKITSGKNLFC
jgi:hypothetical protein